MDWITYTEALVTMLVDRDDVDATNIVAKLRKGQAVLQDQFGVGDVALNSQQPAEEVDNLLTAATLNGNRDIFA